MTQAEAMSLFSSEIVLLWAASKTLLHLADFAPAYFTTVDSKPRMLEEDVRQRTNWPEERAVGGG